MAFATAAAFGATAVAPLTATAAITAVGNCNDDGGGSLRQAVTNAADGDTIDLSGLPCSTITLTSGEIVVDVDNLTVFGAGTGATRIDAGDHSRVFAHPGGGTLKLHELTVRHGKHAPASGGAAGGCIYSKGSVRLDDAVVKYCTAQADAGLVRGGAIYAAGDVLLYSSRVQHGHAICPSDDLFSGAQGGGVFAPRAFVAKYSTVADNDAQGPHASAGGVYAFGNTTIRNSTISGNSAPVVGGIVLSGLYATKKLRVSNSTISGNEATDSLYGAGLSVRYALVLSNSTITDNIEANAGHVLRGAGLFVAGSVSIELQSSIIGGNFLAGGFGTQSDLGGTNPGAPTVGADNLITQSTLGVPFGTIFGHQPLLAALADNGGPTATHRPKVDSLVRDAGNNTLGTDVDQRGPGFERVFGPRADIGAVEFNDRIFADAFD